MRSSVWRRGGGYNFLRTSCTVKEISDMASGWRRRSSCSTAAPYDQIVKAVEISTATISHINRCIQYGSGGYRDTIEKVREAMQAGVTSGQGAAHKMNCALSL